LPDHIYLASSKDDAKTTVPDPVGGRHCFSKAFLIWASKIRGHPLKNHHCKPAKYVTLKAVRADRGLSLRFKRLIVYDTKIIPTLRTGAIEVFAHRWGDFPSHLGKVSREDFRCDERGPGARLGRGGAYRRRWGGGEVSVVSQFDYFLLLTINIQVTIRARMIAIILMTNSMRSIPLNP